MTKDRAYNKAKYDAKKQRKPQAVIVVDDRYMAGPVENLPHQYKENIEDIVQPPCQ